MHASDGTIVASSTYVTTRLAVSALIGSTPNRPEAFRLWCLPLFDSTRVFCCSPRNVETEVQETCSSMHAQQCSDGPHTHRIASRSTPSLFDKYPPCTFSSVATSYRKWLCFPAPLLLPTTTNDPLLLQEHEFSGGIVGRRRKKDGLPPPRYLDLKGREQGRGPALTVSDTLFVRAALRSSGSPATRKLTVLHAIESRVHLVYRPDTAAPR